MFEQDELIYIESIKIADSTIQTAKLTCKKLDAIYSRVNGITSKDCFCSMVRRKIFIKDFFIWYEGLTG
tara:strand:- start:114 stop:320 length:207 start_codon:yes stop_codon:yes gene_type:complete